VGADAQSVRICSDSVLILLFLLQFVGPKPIYTWTFTNPASNLKLAVVPYTSEMLVILTSTGYKDFGAE
jgi:hypothetical protein